MERRDGSIDVKGELRIGQKCLEIKEFKANSREFAPRVLAFSFCLGELVNSEKW